MIAAAEVVIVVVVVFAGGDDGSVSYPITGWEKPLGSQEVETPRISTKSEQEGSKVVSPRNRPLLPPGHTPDTHSC